MRSPRGRSATPDREAVPRTERGRSCHGAGRGGGDSGPTPRPAGPRAPDGPEPPAGAGGLRQGKLLSSFRGAAVPPLAPARRHAPPAPRDSARPPPAVRPAASGPPAAATRNRPSWPGCGRGDDQCAPGGPPRSRRRGRRPAPLRGRCRRPARFVRAAGRRALCSRVRTVGSGSGFGPTGGAGERRCGSCLSLPPGPEDGMDGERPVPATQVRVCGRWGQGWGRRAFPEPGEESGRVGLANAFRGRVAGAWSVSDSAGRSRYEAPASVQVLRTRRAGSAREASASAGFSRRLLGSPLSR